MLEWFLEHLQERDVSPATVKTYTSRLRSFASWFEKTNGQGLTPRAITPIDIRDYKSHLLNVRNLKPSSVNNHLAAIRAYCRWAQEEGLIEADPTVAIRDVEQVRLAPRWLTKNEQYALLRAVQREENRRDIALIVLMLKTGLRVHEVARLTVEDVDMDWQDASNRKSASLTVRGKGVRYRVIPLNADARRALRMLSQVYGGWSEENAEEPLFRAQRGKRYGKAVGERAIHSTIRKYGRIAGIEDLSPHVLRHTFAKNLVDTGASLDKVATLLGHARLNTTAVYTTPSMGDLEDLVGRLSLE